jgi:hypothetical protein
VSGLGWELLLLLGRLLGPRLWDLLLLGSDLLLLLLGTDLLLLLQGRKLPLRRLLVPRMVAQLLARLGGELLSWLRGLLLPQPERGLL